MDCELSEEFEIKVGMNRRCVLSPFSCAVMVDVTTSARELCVKCSGVC